MNTAFAHAHEDEEPHTPHWVSRAAFPLVTLVLLATEAGLFLSLQYGWIWLSVLLVLIASHLMHGQLIGFHEASHGLLRKSRRLNEIDGLFIGVLSFMSFTLYRASHQTHHMHLGTERDEELWPFVDTTKPRWARALAAFCELFLGLIFTPLIFIRTFLRKGSPIRNKKVRRRIWLEFALIIGSWAAILSVIGWLHLWKYYVWMYLAPAVLAANLQSWRKYIEHVGLTGSTVRSATRSIVSETWLGRIVSLTLLHEPYHGVHHQRAGVTHAELPQYTADLEPTHPDEHPPFPSYSHAFFHLLRCLADPRVGTQWRQVEAPRERNEFAAAD